MKLERIVRIEARFKGATKHGTGFRVAPGKVLTAQHVIERGHREKRIEKAEEIWVHWDPDGSGEHLQRVAAKRLWAGETTLDPDDPRALDVALLEDGLPAEGVEPFHRWVPVALGERGRWETSGFASVNPEVGDLASEHLWGACLPAREMATRLGLTVEREEPRDPTTGKTLLWGGISGAPVFVEEGRYKGWLYGVVRSSPKVFSDGLYAVGTPALLRNPELRDLLGIQDPIPPHTSLVERLRVLLKGDEKLAERLAAQDPSWLARWEAEEVDGLVDLLSTQEGLSGRLKNLRPVHATLDPESKRAEDFRELALILVAIGAGQDIPGGSELDLESIQRIPVATGSEPLTEAYLAGCYGKPPRFEPVKDDVPRSFFRIPEAKLESGIRRQSLHREQLEELLTALVEKDLDHPRFLRAADKARLALLPPGERAESRLEQIRENLRLFSWRHGRPTYLLAGNELRKTLGRNLDQFLDKLELALPDLQLVVMESNNEQLKRATKEEGNLYPIWVMLDLLLED